MENQHKKISGYRDLSQSEIDAMNSIKALEKDTAQLWQQVREVQGVDQRALALAKTELQTAFMWFVRAVARPESPFDVDQRES